MEDDETDRMEREREARRFRLRIELVEEMSSRHPVVMNLGAYEDTQFSVIIIILEYV
jgi:hypothetical protein